MSSAGIAPYPMILAPACVPKVWGGRSILDFVELAEAPDGPIGEIWTLSALSERPTLVQNGRCGGMPVAEALERVGCTAPCSFLVKLLESTSPLSLQVHPNDAQAQAAGLPSGKSEAWFVLRTFGDCKIVYGLADGISTAEFGDAVRAGSADLQRYLKLIPVKEGDVIPVPPGVMHTILGHMVWAEVQQSADVTYRLHDWGRQDASRALHIDAGLAAISPTVPSTVPTAGLTIEAGPCSRRLLWACSSFVMEEIHVSGQWSSPTRGHAVEALMGLWGKPQVDCAQDRLPLPPGRTIVIPNGLPYSVSTRAAGRLLRIYQADLETEIRPALVAAGHAEDRIATALYDQPPRSL
jgi:mannose-6-phosphate isomerase